MAPPWAHRSDPRGGNNGAGPSMTGARGWSRDDNNMNSRRDVPVDSYNSRNDISAPEPGQIISPSVQPISLPSRPSFSSSDRRKGSDSFDRRGLERNDRHPSTSYQSRRERSISRDRDRGRDSVGRRSPSPRRRSPSPPSRRRSPVSRRRSYSPISRASSSGPTPPRRRSRSPKRVQHDNNLIRDLDAFSNAMHFALIANNTLALAKAHLSRLQSFPSSSTSPILLEASKSVYTAERELRGKLIDMRDAFGTLTMRFTGIERQTQVSISAPEVDSLKDRLTKLEVMTASLGTSQIVDGKDLGLRLDTQVDAGKPVSAFQPRQAAIPYPGIPNSAPPDLSSGPPPSDFAPSIPAEDVSMEDRNPVTEIEGKRYRARQLLKDVLERMDKVEEDKRAMMTRCDDLENLLWENIEQDMPQMSWERLEASRIASRDLPPRRRTSRREQQGGSLPAADSVNEAIVTAPVEDGDLQEEKEENEKLEVVELSGNSRKEAIQVEDGEVEGWDALETTRDPTGALRGVNGPVTEPSRFTLEEPTVKQEDVDSLRNKVSELEAELNLHKEHQTAREAKIVQACVGVMNGLIETQVKAELSKAIAKIRRGSSDTPIATPSPALAGKTNGSMNTTQTMAGSGRSPSVSVLQLQSTPGPPNSSAHSRGLSAGQPVSLMNQPTTFGGIPNQQNTPATAGWASNLHPGSALAMPLSTPQSIQEFRTLSPSNATMQRSASGSSHQQQVDSILGYPSVVGRNGIPQISTRYQSEGQRQSLPGPAPLGSMPTFGVSTDISAGRGYPDMSDPPQSAEVIRYLKLQQMQQQLQPYVTHPQVVSGQQVQPTPAVQQPTSQAQQIYQARPQQASVQPIDQYIPPAQYPSHGQVLPLHQSQHLESYPPQQNTFVDIPVANSTYPPQVYQTVQGSLQQYHTGVAQQHQVESHHLQASNLGAHQSDTNVQSNESRPMMPDEVGGDVVMEDSGRKNDPESVEVHA